MSSALLVNPSVLLRCQRPEPAFGQAGRVRTASFILSSERGGRGVAATARRQSLRRHQLRPMHELSASNGRRQRRPSSAVRRDSRSSQGMDGDLAGGGSADGGPDSAVGWQRDGLPRLPSHLEFDASYEPETHCPVCSLGGDGEGHPPGEHSHASALFKKTLTSPRAAQPQLRSIDEHGLALLQSLRRPKHPPSWWGARYAKTQERCAHLLESSAAHYTIIALVLLDLGVVITELILSSLFPDRAEMPHAVHTAEEALSWASISILCIFVAELLAKLVVWGHSYYRNWWHMADAVVVVASLSLELTLKGVAQEVASLLVFFRLWRLLRVMHGVAEAMELRHEGEAESHHKLIHGLQQDLAAEHKRVLQLEREVAALAGAASAAGVDVATILRLAATAASQPDLLLIEAAEADAVAAAAAEAKRRKSGRGGSGSGGGGKGGGVEYRSGGAVEV